MKIKLTLKELRAMLDEAERMVEGDSGVDFLIIDTAIVECRHLGDNSIHCVAAKQDGALGGLGRLYRFGEIIEFGDMHKQGAKRVVDALKRIGTYDGKFKFYQLPGDLVGEVLYFMAGPHPDGWNHPYIKELCSDMIVFEIDGERAAFA